MPNARHALALLGLFAAGGACGVAALRAASPPAAAHLISQRDRAFAPGTVTIARGETLTVVNDDDLVIHHAYVDDPAMRFDSGDQTPGDRTEIAFPDAGQFQVLCGIHPKMRLRVEVR